MGHPGQSPVRRRGKRYQELSTRCRVKKMMRSRLWPVLFFLGVFAANLAAAVPRRTLSDEQVVAQAQLVASGSTIEIYQQGVAVEPSFLKIMESVYEQVERVSGLKLDTALLGPRVRVYISVG